MARASISLLVILALLDVRQAAVLPNYVACWRTCFAKPLFLRGAGAGEHGADQELETNVKLPCRSVASALDVVQLVFLTGREESDILAGANAARPLFAHQVFGENETIAGFRNPAVSVYFAADSLLPSLSFEHDNALESVDASATDVVGAIKHAAPADYVDFEQLRQHIGQHAFFPPGDLIGEYSSGVPQGKKAAGLETSGGLEARYELRHIHGGSGNQSSREFLQRTQGLAIWFIEQASYIDVNDPAWSCIALYEKLQQAERVSFRLVGLTTLYRESIDGMDPEALRQLTPLADEIAGRAGMVRLRVAQFLILPHFGGRGHGARLLRAVHALARGDAAVLDVDVEAPNAAFAALRLRGDLKCLREERCMDALRAAEPRWGELQRKLKFSMLQLFALADAVGSRAGRRGVKHTQGGEAGPHATVAGVSVDLEWVYERAGRLGFTRKEIDDVLGGIGREDLEGVRDAGEGARRVLGAVYMAVVADLGEAEGLNDDQVDELLGAVDPGSLVEVSSGRELAAEVLPAIRRIKAGGAKKVA